MVTTLFGQVIYPPAKGVLDFYYIGKTLEFHGDVGGTYDNLRITNYSAVVDEPLFKGWRNYYGSDITLFYLSFSNAYYSNLVAIATNTPENGWGIYYNAANTNWYAAEVPSSSLVELSNAVSSVVSDLSIVSNIAIEAYASIRPEFIATYSNMFLLCDFMPCGIRRQTLGAMISGTYTYTLGEIIDKEL